MSLNTMPLNGGSGLNGGAQPRGVGGTPLGEGLVDGAFDNQTGVIYACGWSGDAVWFVKSSYTDLRREYLVGTQTALKVCDHAIGAGDPPRTAIQVEDDRSILVMVPGPSGATFYRCRHQDAVTPFVAI